MIWKVSFLSTFWHAAHLLATVHSLSNQFLTFQQKQRLYTTWTNHSNHLSLCSIYKELEKLIWDLKLLAQCDMLELLHTTLYSSVISPFHNHKRHWWVLKWFWTLTESEAGINPGLQNADLNNLSWASSNVFPEDQVGIKMLSFIRKVCCWDFCLIYRTCMLFTLLCKITWKNRFTLWFKVISAVLWASDCMKI